jgi:DNA-directed RNA polymerase subunit M/transcription elongation factor TFIIS
MAAHHANGSGKKHNRHGILMDGGTCGFCDHEISVSYYHELVCPACNWRDGLSPDQLLERLRAAGVMRRAQQPEEAEIVELLRAQQSKLVCSACGHVGLLLEEPSTKDEDEDWGDPKPCERCGALIPAERLELFPNTTLCVKCQQAAERGGDSEPAEYCPRCGSIMQLRKARGSGITRYAMECPSCLR